MALKPPPGVPENAEPFTIYPNKGGGYGHGATRELMEPEGYNRTINMTDRGGRTLSPSFAPNFRSTEYNAGHFETYPPAFLIPWVDANGVPMCLFALFIAAWKFKDGALAIEADATTETYASAALADDGATGTPLLYAGTFSTTTGTAQLLNKRTQAGTWSQDADVRAKYLTNAAGALWRTYNGDDVTKEPIHIGKCAAGDDPFTLASWQAAFRVGSVDAKIVSLGSLGPIVVVGKEDGIYTFNEIDSRFENVLKVPHHPNHFPTLKSDGAGGLLTVAASGDVVNVQQFGAITVATPLKNKYVGRDTPHGRISDITTFGSKFFAVTQPGYRLVQPSGMKVYKTVNTTNWAAPGTFTDGTTNVTDQSSTTVLNLNSLDTLANGDAILIGFDDQFLGFNFERTYPPGAAESLVGGVMLVEFSTGAGTFSTMNHVDGTARWSDASSTHRSMQHGGTVAFKPSTDISTWTTATYNGQSKYWVRVSFSSVLRTDAEVPEVSIIEKRGAPNFGNTNNNNVSVWEASGMHCKVLMGERDGDTILWDDVLTLLSVSGAGKNTHRSPGGNKITVSSMPTANSLDTSLVIACHDEFYQFPLPYLFEPSITQRPVLASDSTNTATPTFYPAAVEFEQPRSLVGMEVFARNLTQGTDSLAFAARADDTAPWYVAQVIKENYALWPINEGEVFGNILHTAFQLVDSVSTDPIGPSIYAIRGWTVPYEDTLPLQDVRLALEAT